MSIKQNRAQRRALERRKKKKVTHTEVKPSHWDIQQAAWNQYVMMVAFVLALLVLVAILSGCGTQQTQARVVYQAPPRPDATLLARPEPVPLLVEPVTEETILLKHADEMAERNGLAVQLNGLIDWVLKVTE